MSDGAVYAIMAGVVQITVYIIGFLTLRAKLQYGILKAEETATTAATTAVAVAKVVEDKVDHNTQITAKAAEAATKASIHAETCDDERTNLLKSLSEHDVRISGLESQMSALKVMTEALSKNVDSTRHEMRGQLQTLVSKLDLMSMNMSRATVAQTP